MGRFLVFMGLLVIGFVFILIGAHGKYKEKCRRAERENRFNKEFNKFTESKNEFPNE